MLSTFAALLTLAAPSVPVYVDGDGYMRFLRDGRTVYSKQTVLTVVDEKLASADGPLVNPRIQVPGSPDAITVTLDGRVVAKYAGKDTELGRLTIALFPDDVRPVVDKGFLVSSYRPTLADAGVDTAGVVRTGKPGESTATVTVYSPETLAGGTGEIEINLRESVQIEGKAITLGDIADVTADDATKARLNTLEVATAPPLGVTYKFTQDQLKFRLLRYGKEVDQYRFSGSDQVTVSRKGQDVTQAMFVQAAILAAQEKLGKGLQISTNATGPVFVAPIGVLDLVGEQVTQDGSHLIVRVAVVVDGVRINSRNIALEKSDPVSKMRVGATVKVIVRSNLATVETTGRIKSIDPAANSVVVVIATGAELTGTAVADNTVEVKI